MNSRSLALLLKRVHVSVTISFLLQLTICTISANGQLTIDSMKNVKGVFHISTKDSTLVSIDSSGVIGVYRLRNGIPVLKRIVPPKDIVRGPDDLNFIVKELNADSTYNFTIFSGPGMEVLETIPQTVKLRERNLNIESFSYYELLYYLSTYSSGAYIPRVLKKCLREYYHIVSTNLWPVGDSSGRITTKSFGKEIESLVGADSSDRFGCLVRILKKDPKGKLSEDQVKAIQILTMLYWLTSSPSSNTIPQLTISEDSTEWISGTEIALTYLWYDFFSGLSGEMKNYFDVGRMNGGYYGIVYPSNGTTDTSDAIVVCLHNEYSKYFMFANMRALESLRGERMVAGLKPHYSIIITHDPVHGRLLLPSCILLLAVVTVFLIAVVKGKFRQRKASSQL
jgi:hypothetical protein